MGFFLDYHVCKVFAMYLIPVAVYVCQYVLATLAAINGQYLLGWFIYYPPTFSSLDRVHATAGFSTTVFFAICLFGQLNSIGLLMQLILLPQL